MFIEERLLECVAYGAEFGLQFSTRIVRLKSGREHRNAQWSQPLARGAVMFQNLRPEHHRLVLDAHMACAGSLVGFRFRDWANFQAVDQVIGTGTGTVQTLPLYTVHTFGGEEFQRRISKPVAGTVTVRNLTADAPLTATVDAINGTVTVTAPPGDVIAWSGEYDTPVRFESDELSWQANGRSGSQLLLTADVDLVEIRL